MANWRRFWMVLTIALGLAAPLAAQAQTVRESVIWALEQDSASWSWNRLDRGSYGAVAEQSGYNPGDHVYRMPYTYNAGSPGWTEVFMRDGNVQGIRYHDNSTWATVRTDQARAAAATTYDTGGGGAAARTYTDRELVVWALEQDSGSWGWNRLDYDSYGALEEQSGYNAGDHVFRMTYTYNGGLPGWTEVYILNGGVQGIRYHDNGTWVTVRTSQGRASSDADAAYRAKENCRRQARADGLDTFGQCGW